MENEKLYLIPANSKKSQLLFSMFRPIDLVIFGACALLSIGFLLVITSTSAVATLIKLIPICTGFLLVMPVPSYHNVLVFFQEFFKFFINRRVYYWKGWCVKDEFKPENEQSVSVKNSIVTKQK